MNVARQFGFSFLLLASTLTYAQQPLASTSPSDSLPLEIRLAKPPSWQGNCLRVSIRLANRSRFPIFLPHTPFEGIEVYSSVTDTTNTLGLGAGEAWLLVYGWTDVFYLGAGSPVQGTRSQKTFCIDETFPVKGVEKNSLRKVHLQGRLRVYVNYHQKLPQEKIGKQHKEETTATSQAKGNNLGSWISGRVILEIPIPCPKDVADGNCTVPHPIFPGEHDAWTIDAPEPPPL
jgi:hypothetical protein